MRESPCSGEQAAKRNEDEEEEQNACCENVDDLGAEADECGKSKHEQGSNRANETENVRNARENAGDTNSEENPNEVECAHERRGGFAVDMEQMGRKSLHKRLPRVVDLDWKTSNGDEKAQ